MKKMSDDVFNNLSELANRLRDRCCCENLADPGDRSRYAGYAPNSGYCSFCIDEILCYNIIEKLEVNNG